MPPNTGSENVLHKFECSYKQVANPYSETKNDCFEECPTTSGNRRPREREASEQVVDDTVRVTTRARLTYELYKYSKNAMLIVTSSDNSQKRNAEVAELKTTFEKFRFEVDVVSIGYSNVQLYGICERFLQRDFTDYGAVALTIMTFMGVKESPIQVITIPSFEESVIMDNFKLERNPTLVDKPKIYITEAGRGNSSPLYDHLHALEHATHGDLIGFHFSGLDTVFTRLEFDLKLSPKAVMNRPLKIFCKKLAAMGNNVTLTEIIAQTLKEFDKNLSLLNPLFHDFITPIGVVNTLRKELYFARVEDN